MYWFRQIDALFESFPRLAKWVGTEAFTKLACAYVAQHPSEHHALERLGRRLPSFVEGHSDETLRGLRDMVTLEWTETDAFLAPDPHRIATTKDIVVDQFASATVRLVPSLRRVQVAKGAILAWDDERLESVRDKLGHHAQRMTVVLWRKGYQVQLQALAPDEANAVEAAAAGGSLGEICACFRDDPQPQGRAFRALSDWFAREWLEEVLSPTSVPDTGTSP